MENRAGASLLVLGLEPRGGHFILTQENTVWLPGRPICLSLLAATYTEALHPRACVEATEKLGKCVSRGRFCSPWKSRLLIASDRDPASRDRESGLIGRRLEVLTEPLEGWGPAEPQGRRVPGTVALVDLLSGLC